YEGKEYYPQQVLTFAEHFSCPLSGFSFGDLTPKLFSSNIRESSCEECSGLGKVHTIGVDLIIPDKKISILDGAIDPLGPLSTGKLAPYRHIVLEKCKCEILSVSQKYNIDLTLPWDLLEEKVQNIILWGEHGKISGFKGVIAYLNESKYGIEKYSLFGKCGKCSGYRLNQKGLSVKIRNKHIGELCTMSVVELIEWFNELERDLTESEISISSEIIQEIVKRLKLIVNVGLGYLSLDRDFSSLSGGEAQRIRLASLIGSGLSGLIYVLDEPSIGLHQRDNKLLIDSLKKLRDLLNTVVVIEHDLDTIEAADYILDIGPEAGPNGGRVVAQGSLEDIALNPDSITGKYLNGDTQICIPVTEDKHFTHWIKINGARKNNLKDVDVQIPIGGFTCITGVSGSGKSTLVREILYPTAMHKIHGNFHTLSECDSISGLEHIDKVIQIDQSPIGRTSTSTPATYIGLFTFIRAWFASMPLAKSRKYTESRFSFNTPGGRCEACKGDGSVKIEMHFLPDIYVKCEECNGKRYNKETLEVTYKGKSIADILEMNVDQALLFFKSAPLIVEKLKSLKMVGMGYVKIGQHSATLSGGESQRIKLSRELSKRSTGNTLYILDEPTTGLHISDIQNLLEVLHSLSSLGNTVIVVEHNMHVIKTADYIIDIGPEGGKFGGRVMGFGSPREIVKNYPDSITAEYLKEYL
ncbi:excinuclease ABC subunit UvrA, partial [Anaplasma bovis]|uniref:excinuclease ABC subunit UvrA n=1 Tax=Anaplasma bovis TaxID=186733 RepID=UPI002FF255CF